MLNYFILMRPTLFVPLWIFFLLGTHYSRSDFSWKSALILLLFTLLMSGTYILNQIVDVESDKKNEKLFLLSDGIISPVHARIEMFFLFLVPLSFSWLIGSHIFIFFVVSLIMGIGYSIPPIEFKARPFLDLVWNAIGYGVIAFSLGWISVSSIQPATWIHSLPYFFAVGAVFVNTTILDIAGDQQEGKITTGVFLGKEKTLLFAIILDAIALLMSIILSDYICLIAAGISLPVFIYAFIAKEKKPILLSIRLTSSILAILVCILFPLIIPALIFIYGIQKYYYKRKFNLNYPSLFSGMDKEF